MIVGLDHVHIMCGDVEEVAKYFIDVFSGQIINRGETRGAPVIRLNVQGVKVFLMGTYPKSAVLEVGKGRRGLDHFGLQVKDLDQTAAELKRRGARFSVEPRPSPTGRRSLSSRGRKEFA